MVTLKHSCNIAKYRKHSLEVSNKAILTLFLDSDRWLIQSGQLGSFQIILRLLIAYIQFVHSKLYNIQLVVDLRPTSVLTDRS
jgi:hypothetical protein